MVAGFDFLDDVAGGFEHIVEDFELDIGEASVLPVVVFVSEIDLVGAPASQGFEGDIELGFDAVEVAVVLIEEVERLDFGVESVFRGHGFFLVLGWRYGQCSIFVLCGGEWMVAYWPLGGRMIEPLGRSPLFIVLADDRTVCRWANVRALHFRGLLGDSQSRPYKSRQGERWCGRGWHWREGETSLAPTSLVCIES